ncbi:hypothetical protein [Nocardia brasiliensis]|nr:hypothetical protein [Nocardia brasiliensis]
MKGLVSGRRAATQCGVTGHRGGPCEIMGIFDRDARRGHQRGADDAQPN